MELFKDFVDHDDFQIKNRAVKVSALTELLNAGEITASEYNELIADILDLAKVDNQIEDIERKEAIIKACQIMISIAKKAAGAV